MACGVRALGVVVPMAHILRVSKKARAAIHKLPLVTETSGRNVTRERIFGSANIFAVPLDFREKGIAREARLYSACAPFEFPSTSSEKATPCSDYMKSRNDTHFQALIKSYSKT